MDFKNKITEQPSTFDNLEDMSVDDLLHAINSEDAKVHVAVGKAIPQIKILADKILERMASGGRVFYLGAGTSGRLGVLDASELPPTFGVSPDIVIGLIAGGDTALRRAVEAAEDNETKAWQELESFGANENDTVIGIAASGTTPYIIGGVRDARAHGLLTGCIACNPESPLAAAAEYPVEIIVGAEFLTGSTRMKAGTAQKMALNMLSTTLMIKSGRVKGNRMINMQLTNNKLIDRGTRMIMEETGLPENQARALLLRFSSVKEAVRNYEL